MKKRTNFLVYPLLLMGALLIFISSCKKDKDENPTPPSTNGNGVFTCGDNVTYIYNGQAVTYGTVLSSGNCWLDRNLGATQVATSSTDHLAYGDLFQWGRAADGHQLINWSAWDAGIPVNPATSGTCDAVDTNTPLHSNFIKCSFDPRDWRSPQNHGLWQGVDRVNNPCPPGWRLPTEAEWDAERESWSDNNAAGAFGSPLKLPVVSSRDNINGSLLSVGAMGLYWASTVDGTRSRRLVFDSSTAHVGRDARAFGFSVRCIKDN